MLSKEQELRRNVVEFLSVEGRISRDHLLRKIDGAIDFGHLYDFVDIKSLYSEEKGRPSVDPVVLFKIVLLQHLYGIPSLRRTMAEIDMNMAYRWFLEYSLNDELPHFSTVSYNFRHRYTEETIEQVFRWILWEANEAGALTPDAVFIDGTHIKANANINKKIKKFQFVGFIAAFSFIITRLDECNPLAPRDDAIHLSKKFFLLCPYLCQLIIQRRQTYLFIHSPIISYPYLFCPLCAVWP